MAVSKQMTDCNCSAEKVLYTLIAALGLGCLFQVRLLREDTQTSILTNGACLDAFNCITSCDAHQRYGNEYFDLWVYQVRDSVETS
jgi:hypothetical protein